MERKEIYYEEGLLDPILMDMLITINRLVEELMLDSKLKALDTMLVMLQYYTSFEDGVLERAGFVVQELNQLITQLSDVFESIVAAYLAMSKRIEFSLNDNPEFRHVLDTVRSAIHRTEQIKSAAESLKDAELPFEHASSAMDLLDFADEPFEGMDDPFADEEDDND